MTELTVLVKEFGTVIGLLVFIAYKELPLYLKKRNGKWVDLERIKDSLDKHMESFNRHVSLENDTQNTVAKDLEVYQAIQNQINLNIEKEIKMMSKSMSDNFKTVYGKLDKLAER